MIIDARQLPKDATLTADICIIGAGAAGITLAHALLGSGLSIIVAEGGGEKPAADLAPVFAGQVLGSRHAPIELYRSRCLGGTTELWGGRCVPYDDIDFERRPWVPFSGWPIDRRELEPAYHRAMEYLDAGRFLWRVADALPDRPPQMIPGFADDAVETETIDRFSPPLRFGEEYKADLANDREITVLLHAECLRLGMSPFANRVDILHMASTPERPFTIEAKVCVLAAGGLETPRLLLLSDDVVSSGVGNGAGLVGRFYMCHVEGKCGVIRLRPNLSGVVHRYETDPDGIYCRRRLWINEATQRRLALMNFVARLEHPAIPDPRHKSGILSAMYLSRHFLKEEYARKIASFGNNGEEGPPTAARIAGHLRNLVIDAPALLRFTADWIKRRKLARRRLPYVTLPNRDNVFHVDYYSEQAPNPDSRVTLTSERDVYGRRRLAVDWRSGRLDQDNVAACFRLIQERLAAAGVGSLDYDEDALRANYHAVGGHHIGTARMADNASEGVVDANCRVFGVDNLFITSAATFPTSGYANPTLTIVAMAIRLADHLRWLMGARWVIRPAAAAKIEPAPPLVAIPRRAAGPAGTP